MNATRDDAEQPGTSPQTLIAAGVVALAVGCLYLVSQGTEGLGPAMFMAMGLLLVQEAMRVLLWLAAAAGWGRAVWRAAGGARGQWAAAMAMGVGVMAMWDWTLGLGGWLNVNTAWAVAGLGWALLAAWAYRRRERWYQRPELWPTLPWAIVLAVPAVALMVGVCAVPPGVMWALPSEAGGYDVLSYHLELPKEWIAGGAIEGYLHNVYSYLPNLFEAAYMHVGLWAGSMAHGSYAAQLLHAATAMIAAAAVAQIVIAHTARPAAGAFAAAVYLAVPWTIVTGSMAYNEQFIAALGVAAMGLAMSRGQGGGTIGFGHALVEGDRFAPNNDESERPRDRWSLAMRTGLVVGAMVGMASLGKLTAAGMFGLPIAIVLMMRRDGGWAAWAMRGFGAAVAGAAVLGVWLLRNFMWTGNPTFPMFTERFGAAHWSPEQAQRWAGAHQPHDPLADTIGKLWSMGPGHPQFAYVFWPAVGGALVVALLDRRVRRAGAMIAAAMAAQLLFWAIATHHQSRFMTPMIGPACIAIGLGAGVWRWGHHAARIGAGVAFIGALTIADYALYLDAHGRSAPRMIDAIDLLAQPQRGVSYSPAAAINGLPPDARVYAEAYATPLYVDRRIDYQTVWDRSRLGVALADGGPAAAHDWLRRAGYTHVLIDWGMLARWTAPGNYGYDPNVDPDRLVDLARTYLVALQQWPPDSPQPQQVLYRVR